MTIKDEDYGIEYELPDMVKCGQCGEVIESKNAITAQGFEPVCSIRCKTLWNLNYDARFNQSKGSC